MSEVNIEIGGKRKMPGWTELNNRDGNFNIITDEFQIPDNSVDYFYMSHVIGHIPIPCAESVLKKMYNKLKVGGKLRIVTPDLEVILKAYLEKKDIYGPTTGYQVGTPPQEYARLGLGGKTMGTLMTAKIHEDGDTFLFDKKEGGKFLCSYSHLGNWDFEMLETLLKIVGFSRIERTGDEGIDQHKGMAGQLCVNAYK